MKERRQPLASEFPHIQIQIHKHTQNKAIMESKVCSIAATAGQTQRTKAEWEPKIVGRKHILLITESEKMHVRQLKEVNKRLYL